MKIEKVRLDKYEGPDEEFVTVGKTYETLPDVDEDDGEYAIFDDVEDQHVISPDWCTVIQDEFVVRDAEEQPSEYTGEGIPPIGTKCLYSLGDSTNWFECVVKAVCKNQGAIIECDVEFGEQYVSLYGKQPVRFKPIKSEKDKEIEEMVKVMESFTKGDTKPELAEILYNAGYRKTK